MNTTDIVAKLWSLCHVLRDDGITYQEYVNELSYLLFLKMMQETDQETELPNGYRRGDLEDKDGVDQLAFYRAMLVHLGTEGSERAQGIFANANTSLRQPKNLAKLVQSLDDLDWYRAREEGLGDMYEGLLERNAGEKKSGAGQYFTPRPLIECMVNCIRPKAGEVIQDPAAGTGGFLIAAHRFIEKATNELFDLDEDEQAFELRDAYHAVELVPDAHRLLLMNCNLHTILRLPTGIFYAQGVKTNVLFFTRWPDSGRRSEADGRKNTDTGNTQHVWAYDLRTNMPAFGKRTPLTHEHFQEFERFYEASVQCSADNVQEFAENWKLKTPEPAASVGTRSKPAATTSTSVG